MWQQHRRTVAVIKENYAGPVSRACWSDILCQAQIWQLSFWSRAGVQGKIEEKQGFTAEDLCNYLFNLLIKSFRERADGRCNHQGRLPLAFLPLWLSVF